MGYVHHGFVRTADGTITTFDVRGAGTGPDEGTLPGGVDCLNPAGTIVGYYVDASDVSHGFVRAADGTITTFDAPGAGTDEFEGTIPAGINPAGVIAGEYIDMDFVYHGFVRAANGTITTFDAPGAEGSVGTIPNNINAAGAITGVYFDASFRQHGFVRTPDGTITTFDVPGAFSGTIPICNNPADAITGFYDTLAEPPVPGQPPIAVYHGFLRTP
jgi:predicted membrane protein